MAVFLAMRDAKLVEESRNSIASHAILDIKCSLEHVLKFAVMEKTSKSMNVKMGT